mgnify:CR=1 FL=1
MKRIVLIILGIILFSGCSSSNALKTMDYNEFKEKIEKKETFVAYISRTGCSHCESFEPTLIKVLNDYNIEAYKINLANVTTAEEKSIKKKVGLEGTPTLIYIEEGKSDIDGSLIGETTYENTVDFFKEIEMIKE